MTLFITSSPFVDGADRAILDSQNGLADRLREALPPFPRCLYICSSPDRRDLNCQFGADVFQIFAEAGMPFSGYAVLDGYNIEEAADLIDWSDLIVLAGGHVPTQNAFFHEAGLDALLWDYEGVILGISAGSMNMAVEVYVQPEEPGEAIDPDYRRFAPGLGLTSINICPHYQKVKDNILDGMRLFEDITYADSMGKTFYALPDGSYFYQTEEELLLCGRAWRIQNGILELLTVEEEVLDMSQLGAC